MNNYFSTQILTEKKLEWLNSLIEITNPMIENSKKNNKKRQ